MTESAVESHKNAGYEIPMRLRELQDKLDQVDESELDLDFKHQGNGGIALSNLSSYRAAVIQLRDVAALEAVVEPILSSPIFKNDYESYNLVASYDIPENARRLASTVEGLKAVLREIQPEEDPHSISVLMPPDYSMHSVVESLKVLELGISQVVLDPLIGGEVTVQTWTPGSLWVEISLGSAAVVTLIGRIVWVALFLERKKLENEIVREQLRALKIENDAKQNIEKAQAAHIEMLLESEAKAIEVESHGNSIPERLERLKFSISSFTMLIGKGARVVPALNAPAAEKNEFPDFTFAKNIESRVKLLPQSLEEEVAASANEAKPARKRTRKREG